MSFLDPSELLEPTGRDCPVCKGTGNDPKKRTRRCPERFCQGGKEVRPSDEEEFRRRHEI